LDQHTSEVVFGQLKDIKRKQETPVNTELSVSHVSRESAVCVFLDKGVVKMRNSHVSSDQYSNAAPHRKKKATFTFMHLNNIINLTVLSQLLNTKYIENFAKIRYDHRY
jgi:hypothetical protein